MNDPSTVADIGPESDDAVQVHFSLSGLSFNWDGDRYESLLELAVDQGIDVSAGCRYGDCGTCSTQLLEGAVTYNHVTGIDPDAGYCLPCSCRPLTSITLKA
jgi:ferredoxin